MKLFGREEINTGRQFEFDFAKAVCILGMVFVHCFETFSAESTADVSAAYYLIVVVLDCVFGAGTFMLCMGLGIAYSWKNRPGMLIRRGLSIFILGYLLNFLRDGIPQHLFVLLGWEEPQWIIIEVLCLDIMQFAGLALMLFGLLKKWKLSDFAVFLVALGLSLLGSFVRFLDFGHFVLNQLAGLFIGTVDSIGGDTIAAFPLCNWFIIVVVGYLYAKALRRCTDVRKYYAVSFPVSAAVLAVYFLIAIPRGLGLMCGDLMYYYQMTTFDVLILFTGAVFASGLYHFIAIPFSDKAKKVITRISSNINRIYCIHWVIIGWMCIPLYALGCEGLSDIANCIAAVAIFIVSVLLAEFYTRRKEAKSAQKGAQHADI